MSEPKFDVGKPADNESFQSIEIKGTGGVKMGIGYDGREYVLFVENIPFEDKSNHGKISRKSEAYELKTSSLDVAKRIHQKMTTMLSRHVNGEGSVVGFFRQGNWPDLLKNVITEEWN